MTSRHPAFASAVAASSQRAAVYAVVLWIVAEGDLAGWMFLLPIAALVGTLDAAASGWRIWRVRPLAAARLAGYFIVQSVRAGVDVALRALRPSLPIDPGMTLFALRLTDPASRVLFANVVSLLPGTLAVRLDGERLHLHVLDAGVAVEPGLRELERRVAALHGTALERQEGAP